MGKKATDPIKLNLEQLKDHLHHEHSIYMDLDGKEYYLTDVNFQAWRAQDVNELNDKGHYTDCSDLVPSVDEFTVVDFHDGKNLTEVVEEATFYESLPKDAE